MPKAIQKRAFSGIFKCPGQSSESILPSCRRSGLCVCGGSFLIPPFIPGLQFQGAAAGVFREDGRGGQKGAGRVGEAEGELTFCAPRRRGRDMKH